MVTIAARSKLCCDFFIDVNECLHSPMIEAESRPPVWCSKQSLHRAGEIRETVAHQEKPFVVKKLARTLTPKTTSQMHAGNSDNANMKTVATNNGA